MGAACLLCASFSAGLFDHFATRSESLVENMVALVLVGHNVIGAVLLLVLLAQTLLVLAGFYLRPVKTLRQFAIFLLILFAVLGICSITIWLLAAAYGTQ